MATTNLNTNIAELSTDIYEVSNFINNIREQTITDIDATSAMVGIFGYLNEVHSQSLQDVLIAISETTNETLATRAKFSKNVLAHAMNLAIKDIDAQPAIMSLMLYLPIDYMEENFVEVDEVNNRSIFRLDHEVPIRIDSYEFHLDYDIIITRIKNQNGKYVYTAIYDLFDDGTTNIKQRNPISNITNPYITTIMQTTINNHDYVGFAVKVHQVSLTTINKNILTDNSIENKTVTFNFGEQLADFNVDVVEATGEKTHLTPIYSGLLDYTVEDGEWCYYEYLSENTIRIIFSRDSYVPGLNSEVTINVWLSEGANGNFTYNDVLRIPMVSEKYNNYSGMYMLIYPLSNGISTGGKNKKSIADLRKIIPREASSRGSVINTTDLNNFFNSINDDNNHIFFYKKRDNPFERLYYAYMITKKMNTVYPTNTLKLVLEQSDFKGFAGNNNLVINPGTIFYYYDHGTDNANAYATVVPPVYVEGLDEEEYPYPMTKNIDGELVRVFEYISPFLISVDDDLVSSYFLTIMNDNKLFKFESINTESDIQFIVTNMNWRRDYIYSDEDSTDLKYYDNRYIMTLNMVQNTESSEYKLITKERDENGESYIKDCRVRAIMVLYSDSTNNHPYRYIEGECIDYDGAYTFEFVMQTDDLLDLNNRINITGIYNAKPEPFQHLDSIDDSHGYMNKNTYAKLFVLADFGTKAGDIVNNVRVTEETEEIILFGEDGIGNRTELENLVPVRQDIIDEFLKNNIYIIKDGSQYNVITIMKSNPYYMNFVYEYNGNDQSTETMILRYLRNNKDSDFVKNILLKDDDVETVINSYSYLTLDRYTMCNSFSVDGGVDFYHDYSKMMSSTITVNHVPETDDNGEALYKEITRTDSLGLQYVEYKPIYKVNEFGTYYYKYTIDRIPMIKNGFLDTEDGFQDFIFDLEIRRKYMEECILFLEDTFGVDLKFVNTFGPSRRFYYNIPTSENYKVRVLTKNLAVYSNIEYEEIAGWLAFGDEVNVNKVNGIWGHISHPYDGWIKLEDTDKLITYIDNVALTFNFATEIQSTADRYVTTKIVQDIKDYIENINEIIELHMPNIITLITNNYREQLKYFEFLKVNQYDEKCQHIYLNDIVDADTPPEFLNVMTAADSNNTPLVDITVF